MDVYKLAAYFAGSLVVISAIPQIFKIAKRKSAGDVSLPMFLMLITANTIWFLYGLHIKDNPVIVTNALAWVVSFTNIVMIVRYKNG